MMNYITRRKLKLFDYFYSKIIKRYYKSNTDVKGDIRHYPPANKEWKDSIYSYNKNYMRSLPVKSNYTNRIIKSHFYLTNLRKIARSKRMRNLIMKRSSKKIFISKPHIKHNNDKIVVNLYTFNRQKQFLMRKLFFYRRKYNLIGQFMKNPLLKNIKFNRNLSKNIIRKRRILFRNKNKQIKGKRVKKIRFPFFGMKYKVELDYLRYRTLNIYKKFAHFNNIFIFMFFSKLLSIFNIRILIPTNKDASKQGLIINILRKKPDVLIWVNNKFNKLNTVTRGNINKDVLNEILFNYKYSDNDIFSINKYIFYYIQTKLIDTGIISEYILRNKYLKFKYKYYNKFFYSFFKRRDKIIHYIAALELNNLKFTKLLYNLKILISRIYSKKAELNITNLKYPFLNSDIYTDIIVNKVKRKIKFLRVLSSSLSLSKKPKDILYREKEKLKLNKYKYLYNFKSLMLEKLSKHNNDDELNNLFTKLYPEHFVNKKSGNYIKGNLSKIISVLNTIKFKWVSGVRLEGSGRLTRRYTAARSVFKFKYKGSLRNKQYYLKNDELKVMSTVMLRNTIKSNSQYTFIKSRRRIGSFGIKSWVSSY